MIESLKSQLIGGYNKIDILQLADNLLKEIAQLDMELEKKRAGEKYVIPAAAAEIRLRTAAWGGYSKTDADTFIAELRGKAAELRSQLDD